MVVIASGKWLNLQAYVCTYCNVMSKEQLAAYISCPTIYLVVVVEYM